MIELCFHIYITINKILSDISLLTFKYEVVKELSKHYKINSVFILHGLILRDVSMQKRKTLRNLKFLILLFVTFVMCKKNLYTTKISRQILRVHLIQNIKNMKIK